MCEMWEKQGDELEQYTLALPANGGYPGAPQIYWIEEIKTKESKQMEMFK